MVGGCKPRRDGHLRHAMLEVAVPSASWQGLCSAAGAPISSGIA